MILFLHCLNSLYLAILKRIVRKCSEVSRGVLPVFLRHVSVNSDRLKFELVEDIIQVLSSLDSRAENDGLVVVQLSEEGNKSSGLFLLQDGTVVL